MHERLFALTRLLREGEGGEVACCGSFLPSFVSLLPDSHTILSDSEVKTVLRVLKEVSGGARRVCRASAEIQVGLCGINWRQTTIGQFFKPKPLPAKPRVKRDYSDSLPTNRCVPPPLSKSEKNRLRADIVKHNSNLNVDNIFISYINDDNTVYWEFRAG